MFGAQFVQPDRAHRHGGRTGAPMAWRQYGPREDHRARSHHAAGTDAGPVQDGGIVLHHAVVTHRASVNHGIAAHADTRADGRAVDGMRDVHGGMPAHEEFGTGMDDVAVAAQRRKGLQGGPQPQRHAAQNGTAPVSVGQRPLQHRVHALIGQDQGSVGDATHAGGCDLNGWAAGRYHASCARHRPRRRRPADQAPRPGPICRRMTAPRCSPPRPARPAGSAARW